MRVFLAVSFSPNLRTHGEFELPICRGQPLCLSQFGSLGGLTAQKKRLGKWAFAADFERAEVFIPRAVGRFRFGLTPQLQFIKVFCSDFALSQLLKEVIAQRRG